MGLDVLVGHALFMALDPKQRAKRQPYPPLGTLYAAAGLRGAGHEPSLFDAMLAPDERAFAAALDTHRPQVVVLFEDSFNYLSKMCLGRMREAALDMVAQAAARRLPVVVAGSDASDAPEAYLAAGALAVMTGEADHTVVEVLAALQRSGAGLGPDASKTAESAAALGAVPGLVLRDGTRTAPRPPERDPDVFAWPARDLVEMAWYRAEWQAAHGEFALNMASTRGCPFHCNWCAKPIWGQRYAMRSPEDVAAEMAEVKATWQPDLMWFADDIFGLRPEWTADFGRHVAARAAQVPFKIQSRVDLITDEAALGLAQAGCAEVWLGAESGSQRILDAMEKGTRVPDVRTALTRLRRHGIRVCFFLQLGYPGEDWPDIEATRSLVMDLMPDDIGVSVSYPLPGTPFHAAVATELGSKRHWDDSDDLAMMFHGTYTTAVYRQLHRLLHDELAARRARSRTSREQVRALGLEWARLSEEAEGARSRSPTRIPLPRPKAAPDLSRSAN